MKENIRMFTFLIFVILTFSFNKVAPNRYVDKCAVVEIYEAVTADYGVKVLTAFGTLEDADLILLPTTIEKGSYKVNVTRKATDLYALEGTEYCIETDYCLELALYDEAILEVDNNYGYTKGTLFFK